MIFELPIDHFPARSVSQSKPRKSKPSFLPFTSASCLELNKALKEEPEVTRISFSLGKSASVNCLVSETRMPRLSLSVPPMDRIRYPESCSSSSSVAPTRKPSLCERLVNTLSFPTVAS